jgi:uncharacterized Zn finger protein (UPF0148 family)
MFCKKCGTQLKDGAKFCPQCGAAVSVPVIPDPNPPQEKMSVELLCKNCGTALKEGALFCENCGANAAEGNHGNIHEEENTTASAPETPDIENTAQTGQQDAAQPTGDPLSTEESGDPLEIIPDKNAEITRLIADIERLTQERNQNDEENRKIRESLEKTKAGLKAAIVIGVVGIIISIVVGYNALLL